MGFLKEGTKIEHDGAQWEALPLEFSRWLDYHGPSVIEAPGKGRLFADVDPDGNVTLLAIKTVEGKCTYGTGPTGVPGETVGAAHVAPGARFEDETAASDPTATEPAAPAEAALKEFEEAKHPRDPGGQDGGRFIPKGTTGANDPTADNPANHHADQGLAPIDTQAKGKSDGQGFGLHMALLPPEVQAKISAKFQKDLGVTPEQAKTNLNAIVDEAMEMNRAKALHDANWYHHEHDWGVEQAKKFGVSEEVFFASVAALSPGCRWDNNKKRAEQVAADFHKRPYKLDERVAAAVNHRLSEDRAKQIQRQAARDLGIPWRTKKKPWSPAQEKAVLDRAADIDGDFPPAHVVKVGDKVPDIAKVSRRGAAIALASHNRMGLRSYAPIEAAVAVYLDGPEAVTGPKPRSFNNNLRFPDGPEDVTVDVWHWRATAMGVVPPNTPYADALMKAVDKDPSAYTGSPSYKGSAVGLYPIVADITREVAKEASKRHGVDLNVSAIQALIWIHMRDKYPIQDVRDAHAEEDA